MKIFLKTLRETILYEINPKDSIKDIKLFISKQFDIPVEKVILYHVYTELEENKLVSETQLYEYSTIEISTETRYENVKLYKEKLYKEKFSKEK